MPEKSDNKKVWYGIPRDEIDWHPTIDPEKCVACLSCVRFCKQGVYVEEGDKPKVVNPQNCVVGCRGCESVCPMGAISHPSDDYLEQLKKDERYSDEISDCCSSCKLS